MRSLFKMLKITFSLPESTSGDTLSNDVRSDRAEPPFQ